MINVCEICACTEYCCCIVLLYSRQQNLEKDKSTHLYNKSGEFYREFSSLQELDMKFNDDFKSEGMIRVPLSSMY